MVLANTEDHLELSQFVRTFLTRNDALALGRAALDGEPDFASLDTELAELGWLGVHLPESVGGGGAGLLELAVIVHELGRWVTPGSFVPTAITSAAIAAHGSGEQQETLLPDLASGVSAAGLGLGGSLRLEGTTVSGDAGQVTGAADAKILALVVGDDVVILDAGAAGVSISNRENLDPTRPVSDVHLDGVEVAADRVISGAATTLRYVAQTLFAAEASGLAAACTDHAAAYARERIAFGRPIGQFQSVKHHCANMLIEAELATAAAWDAARQDLTEPTRVLGETAVAVALPAALFCAEKNIQVHGGIGFTWEHDAHLYLRRAGALLALAGPVHAAEVRVAEDARQPAPRTGIELPEEAEKLRVEIGTLLAKYRELPEGERHQFLADSGYLYPHWPQPYGLAASALEQIVIDEEFKDIPRTEPLGPTWWTLPIILPTIMTYGTEDQKDRYIRPSMEAKISWCQLFSEPGAGSDLAALSMKAVREEGGWRINGQKVWTSYAHLADKGLILVRTDRDAAKHKGITCMVVDMAAEGVSVRPLKQITGESRFNEVFFDDVFVPDEDVIGSVNDGWRVALTALGNERVTLGDSGWDSGEPWENLVELVLDGDSTDAVSVSKLGRLAARTHASRALNIRAASRAVAGGEPGVEGNLAKLVQAETGQQIADLGLDVLGPAAVYSDGREGILTNFFLLLRMVTLAGGTSEVVRNILGEKVLGLPRDPAPTPKP